MEGFLETEVRNDVETVKEAEEEHPGHRTQANEEAGSSIVLQVGHDTNEKEKNDRLSGAVCYEDEIMMELKQEETNEAAAAAKKTLESNEEISKEDSSRREEPHPKRRNNDWQKWANK